MGMTYADNQFGQLAWREEESALLIVPKLLDCRGENFACCREIVKVGSCRIERERGGHKIRVVIGSRRGAKNAVAVGMMELALMPMVFEKRSETFLRLRKPLAIIEKKGRISESTYGETVPIDQALVVKRWRRPLPAHGKELAPGKRQKFFGTIV